MTKMANQIKRFPAIEKEIKDITKEDIRVAVSGVIVNKNQNSFLLDDSTGQILVISETIPNYNYLRVFGRIIPIEDHLELQAEFIQDLSNINKKIHKKIKELQNQNI